MTITADPTPIVHLAASQIGYSERSGNRTKFGEWYGLDGNPWCAMFVSWVFWHAGYPLPPIRTTKGFAYVPDVVAYAKRTGQWRAPSHVPKPGDLLVFSFGGIRPDHVGIVESVLPDGRIAAIEGNTNGAGSRTGGSVLRKYRRANIVGFVDVTPTTPPAYVPPAETPTPIPTEEDDVAALLVSDGNQVWITDGILKRRVPFSADRFNELVFLGQAKNNRNPDGGVDVPTLPDYLAEIPVAGGSMTLTGLTFSGTLQ